MAVRAQFENSNESVSYPLHPLANAPANPIFRVGVFSTLTNAYAIVAIGASENFYRCVRLSFLGAL